MGRILDQYGRPIARQRKPNPIQRFVYYLGLRESKAKQPSSENSQYRPIDERRFEMEVAASRLARAVAIIGVVVAVIYFFQMQANIRQADSAEKQLAAMTNQIAEMTTESRNDQRAWVFPFHIRPLTNEPVGIQIEYKNTGKTPALHLHGGLRITSNSNLVPNFDPPEIHHSSETVLPDGVCEIEAYFNRVAKENPNVLLDFLAGKTCYAFGTVWYDDVFGIAHWTQVCIACNKTDEWFRYAPFHNECDNSAEHNGK
jgi:hypothetical protein